MEQKIFELSLGVAAISAYILIDDLTGSGQRSISWDEVSATWTISESELMTAVNELMDRGILQRHQDELTLMPVKNWT